MPALPSRAGRNTPRSRRVALSCPAKVNLALSVGSPRPTPAGLLHPIASWMAAVDFADPLVLVHATGDSRFDLAFADDAPLPAAVDWPLEKDLTFRAHQLLQRHVGRALPVHLTLRKRIPAGTGLGGGSSDAATTLVGLDRLFDLRLGEPALTALGAQLGSDVAFLVGAVLGRPSAIVSGFGADLTPAPMREPLRLVLVLPRFGCPTGEVYRAFDRLHEGRFSSATHEPDMERVAALTRAAPLKPDAPFNDLAEPACQVRPELAGIRDRLGDALRLSVHITGSGSALFVLATTDSECQALAQQVTAVTGLPAVTARTLPCIERQ